MTQRNTKGKFNKARFDWKKKINASSHLSRGAKQLASHLCDDCVGKDTGMFWHLNKTLAAALGVANRTVQRYLKELKDAGWLREVRVKHKRRAFQISFPSDPEGDNEEDKLSPSNMTQLSSKGDTAVALYKNQDLNQEEGPCRSPGFQSVLVMHQEENALKEWGEWLTNHPTFDASEMLDLLKRPRGYLLPSRYPNAANEGRYEAFFLAALASKGFKS